jgi:pimeloyl-ACP methyl ester carboxylesterase
LKTPGRALTVSSRSICDDLIVRGNSPCVSCYKPSRLRRRSLLRRREHELGMKARSEPMREIQIASLPGVRLCYLDSGGRRGTPAQETVIFLHAMTGTHASWLDQLESFAQAGYRTIAYDRRGFGSSEGDPDSGLQPGHACDDLDALADHLAVEKFHLVATAAGAQVALDYAAWHGERLASLVLAASLGPGQTEPELAAFSARIAIPGLASLPPHYREVGASFRGSHPEAVQRWLEIAASARRPGAPLQPLRSANTYAKLATIEVPSLVLAGGADLLSPPALMRLWAAHLPCWRWALLPDAGHALNLEQPELFNDMVLDFLREQRQDRSA